MIRIGVVGLGKMGLSHLAIVRSHPGAQAVAACDTSTYLTHVLGRETGLTCHADLDTMLQRERLDAVLIATPSELHATMVERALQRDLHVFCEKPFVLDVPEGERLVALAETRGLVTQVGYQSRFVATFAEAARIVAAGALGPIHHVRAEAYGPVILRPTSGTWRSARGAGGGALYDYACHAIDLVGFVVGTPQAVGGVVVKPVFSGDVDDEVYCSMAFADGATGQLAVNWSDESVRKMTTRIVVWGRNGRLCADRQECQVYLREAHPAAPELATGWTVRYATELTEAVWYYLRGEEYSAQIDYFVRSVEQGRRQGISTFRSALETDRVVAMIRAQQGRQPGPVSWSTMSTIPGPQRKPGLWARLFG